MKKLTKALLASKLRSDGICICLNRVILKGMYPYELRHTIYYSLKIRLIRIVKELDIYSGSDLHPIRHSDMAHGTAYITIEDLWDKETEYGRNRRRVFVELLKFIESDDSFNIA